MNDERQNELLEISSHIQPFSFIESILILIFGSLFVLAFILFFYKFTDEG